MGSESGVTSAAVYVTDAAQIPPCCGCGVDQAAATPIQPLAGELPYAAGLALKKKKKKKDKDPCPGKKKVGIPRMWTLWAQITKL